MYKKISFNDLEIQKLFQNFYIIPNYQREYVWGEKEVNQLLSDIYDAFCDSSESEYFLGSIVVCRSGEPTKFEVIDGQQRLITLSIILNCIRRIYKKNKENPSSIESMLYSTMITEAGETVNSNIVEIQYEGRDVLYDLYYTDEYDEINPMMVAGLPGKTICESHNFVTEFFNSSFPEDEFTQVKKFLGYFLNKVKVIQIETPEIGKALKIFETINERGISLDQVDLLKNLLFIQMQRTQFQKLAKDWDKFKKSILGERIKEKPLRFLRYFIMANYEITKDKKGEYIIREDDIYDWFVKNEPKCNYINNALAFVRKLQENANFYMNLLKNRYYSEDNLYLENLSKLVGSGFKQHYLILLAAKDFKDKWFNHFVKQLETVLFYYTITKEAPRDIEKRFASWTTEIRKIEKTEDLNDFIANRFFNELDMRKNVFETNFINLNTANIQKYKLKYILAKLINFIENLWEGCSDYTSINQYMRSSIHIEHILPEKPKKELIEDFSNGDIREYDNFKYKLGNLTLLESPINTSIKRDFYKNKVFEYAKSKFYLNRSINKLDTVGTNTSINRISKLLLSFDVWNKGSIDKRSQMLLDIAKKAWVIEKYEEYE